MFLEDVLSDLQRKSYLESERLKLLDENKVNDFKEENIKSPIDLIKCVYEHRLHASGTG